MVLCEEIGSRPPALEMIPAGGRLSFAGGFWGMEEQDNTPSSDPDQGL